MNVTLTVKFKSMKELNDFMKSHKCEVLGKGKVIELGKRKGYQSEKKKGLRYTEAEKDFIRDNYLFKKPQWVAHQLNRTVGSVRVLAGRMGLTKKRASRVKVTKVK
jgi:hypothetical protein